MEIPFVTCDVFTEERFGGNQLAVIPEAYGLTDEQMQLIAAEFNYSETTFVLPADDPAHTARVRIFTPKAEMPFAGHPNIGTALMLADLGLVSGDEVAFEEVAGLVRIRFTDTQAGRQAVLTAPRAPSVGEAVPVAKLADLSGLPEEAISTERHPPVLASAGTEFLFVELTDISHLEALKPSVAYAALPGEGVYFYAVNGTEGFCGRMFAPKHGIPEDPATGSAAAALAGLLASLEAEDDVFSWTLEQGVEMGRPSRMAIGAVREDGVVKLATVGGGAVAVSRGMMMVEG